MITSIAVALAVGFLGWAYQALKPPPPKICGSPNGPLVTSPRVALSDGRHLAYRESGLPKEEANYKIIVIHGFNSSKDLSLPIPQRMKSWAITREGQGLEDRTIRAVGMRKRSPSKLQQVKVFPQGSKNMGPMVAGSRKNFSAQSADANSKKRNPTLTSLLLYSAMITSIAVALAVGFLGWAYQALKPPPPKICGSPNGPLVTSPRVALSDGRHLAYRESGLPKEEANYKIIVIHGFNSSKDLSLPIPQEVIDELKIYLLFFDRAGYGESDPYPSRSVKSEAFDIQELADKLQIGSKFYLIGFSLGAYPVWSCLKYIPHRLSGASLVVPFVNYWWSCFPAPLAREAFGRLPISDQWTFRIAHYTPWLAYWWMTQRWFPSLRDTTASMVIFTDKDKEIWKRLSESPPVGEEKMAQQGVHESLHRDLIVSFRKWEFDPLDIVNPFPDSVGLVHIWQGYEDKIIHYKLSRYISNRLPWIHYHEVPNGGHLMFFDSNHCEAFLRALLVG
ncbi:hypothetical protein FNV43_RR17682 [Rhamnella rubrinervis]|uniref:AB hydrolase-1 domain-containing protein n=1 Tax=Rhamnella rubrinervis TaxID=2594499 RepID=A0A8K0GV30_9ROSA|nr:hypothetical protein FNV43_RR17682 [Rhamnella rubrinervis]